MAARRVSGADTVGAAKRRASPSRRTSKSVAAPATDNAPARQPLRPLARADFPVDTAAFARYLLGKLVVREFAADCAIGRIVETEAYLVGDPAGHAFRGLTPRNRSLFLEPGHAYVYLAYGTSWMLNVSSGPAGVGAGVLVRALEPLEGIPLMQAARGTMNNRDLARGPGRLAGALRIGPELDGIDLCVPGPLWLAEDGTPPNEIGASTRIGLTRAADRVLRFYQRGSPYVSGPKRLNL
ncbi:MAG: DNA-3-methyladenine glycosylase [Methylobacteriaceae bacterium]|nr:DNA-3-methyladenine glycosylase [Methylobacteriaceae bacterium]